MFHHTTNAALHQYTKIHENYFHQEKIFANLTSCSHWQRQNIHASVTSLGNFFLMKYSHYNNMVSATSMYCAAVQSQTLDGRGVALSEVLE